jgi:hypothetical protein
MAWLSYTCPGGVIGSMLCNAAHVRAAGARVEPATLTLQRDRLTLHVR